MSGADVMAASGEGLRLRYTLVSTDQAVTRLAWSPDGTRLAVPARDHSVRLYRGASGEERKVLHGHAGAVLSAAWSPDGTRLVTGGYDDRLLMWDVSTGAVQHAASGHAREVNAVAWSPTGELVASSAEDGQVILHDAADGLRTRHVIATDGALHCAWSPDGSALAVAGADGFVRVWKARPWMLCATFEAATDAVVMLAWSPDGTTIVGASKDQTLRVCPLAANGAVRTLREHAGEVVAVAISPDGALMASKSRDGTVLLWSARDDRPIAVIEEETAPSGWCVALAFHPTVPLLVTSGAYGRLVRLWDLDVTRLLAADVAALLRVRAHARPTERVRHALHRVQLR